MSFIGALLGRLTITDYEVLFDDQDKVIVKTEPKISPIKIEYLRLYGHYLSKIIYNFGGPDHRASQVALGALEHVLNNGISENMDVFKVSEFDDILQYSSKIGDSIFKISGTFYGWKNGNRSITTNFPLNVTEQITVYASLAIMQFAINENKNSKENLIIFEKMAKQILTMHDSGYGKSLNESVDIPNAAFLSTLSA